jgi:hypothetical protein
VWVDFCSIAGTTPGTFTPATISPVSVTNGSYDGENGRGFYIYGNPSTVTATLSNATGKFNWCAYGSDYPPNAVDNTSGGYDFRGTPPFVITTSAGTAEVNAYTYSGGTITALTDATGCPGALCGKNGESAGVLNCCVHGTTNCSGACTTNGTYTTNDGACSGSCETAYVQLRDQCGSLLNPSASTYEEITCSDGCEAQQNPACNHKTSEGTTNDPTTCTRLCTDLGYAYWYIARQAGAYRCYCCN